MLKHFVVASIVALCLSLSTVAATSDREADVNRIDKATPVFREIMSNLDEGIPNGLLESAKCIAIIPGDKNFAFEFGSTYGRGLVICKTEHGWSAPMFLAVEGRSVGYEIGGSSTDLVMLFMNDHASESLLSDNFTLGIEASVAAGPVGRNAAAGVDPKTNAGILSYSRSKGFFTGVSFDGAVVRADEIADQAMYGADVDRHEILSGNVSVLGSAAPLLHEVGAFGN
jgi:lipid-binding SYLF domain-containing protein